MQHENNLSNILIVVFVNGTVFVVYIIKSKQYDKYYLMCLQNRTKTIKSMSKRLRWNTANTRY